MAVLLPPSTYMQFANLSLNIVLHLFFSSGQQNLSLAMLQLLEILFICIKKNRLKVDSQKQAFFMSKAYVNRTSSSFSRTTKQKAESRKQKQHAANNIVNSAKNDSSCLISQLNSYIDNHWGKPSNKFLPSTADYSVIRTSTRNEWGFMQNPCPKLNSPPQF